MKITIDIYLDGYETQEEHREGVIKFIKDNLIFAASSVKIIEVFDDSEDWDYEA